MIHGMVERPLVLTLEDLKRFPSVTRTYFIECAGNGQNGYRNPPDPELTATRSRGLASNASWTGVPLALLLKEAGVKPGARWLIPEGMDAAMYTRSLPLEKAMEDVLVAYAQNGEALRPEQGYPVRLVVPGWEGSIQVKWLRRILVTDLPAMAKDETSEYTDVTADGRVLAFTWVMEPQSIITYPSGGQRVQPGFHEIRGLAWSGFGRIAKVEVSFDEGRTWRKAVLEPPWSPTPSSASSSRGTGTARRWSSGAGPGTRRGTPSPPGRSSSGAGAGTTATTTTPSRLGGSCRTAGW